MAEVPLGCRGIGTPREPPLGAVPLPHALPSPPWLLVDSGLTRFEQRSGHPLGLKPPQAFAAV